MRKTNVLGLSSLLIALPAVLTLTTSASAGDLIKPEDLPHERGVIITNDIKDPFNPSYSPTGTGEASVNRWADDIANREGFSNSEKGKIRNACSTAINYVGGSDARVVAVYYHTRNGRLDYEGSQFAAPWVIANFNTYSSGLVNYNYEATNMIKDEMLRRVHENILTDVVCVARSNDTTSSNLPIPQAVTKNWNHYPGTGNSVMDDADTINYAHTFDDRNDPNWSHYWHTSNGVEYRDIRLAADIINQSAGGPDPESRIIDVVKVEHEIRGSNTAYIKGYTIWEGLDINGRPSNADSIDEPRGMIDFMLRNVKAGETVNVITKFTFRTRGNPTQLKTVEDSWWGRVAPKSGQDWEDPPDNPDIPTPSNPGSPPSSPPIYPPSDPGPSSTYMPVKGYPTNSNSGTWGGSYQRCYTTRIAPKPSCTLKGCQVSNPTLNGSKPKPTVTGGAIESGYTTIPNISWGATHKSNYNVSYTSGAGSSITHGVSPSSGTVSYTYQYLEEVLKSKEVDGPAGTKVTEYYIEDVPRSGSGTASIIAWDGCGDSSIPGKTVNIIDPRLKISANTTDTGVFDTSDAVQDKYDMATKRTAQGVVKKDNTAQFGEKLNHSWNISNPNPIRVSMNTPLATLSPASYVPWSPKASSVTLGNSYTLNSNGSHTVTPGNYSLTKTNSYYPTLQHDVDNGRITATMNDSSAGGTWEFPSGRGRTGSAYVTPDGLSYAGNSHKIASSTRDSQLTTTIPTDSWASLVMSAQANDASGDGLLQEGEGITYKFVIVNDGSTVMRLNKDSLKDMGANLNFVEYEAGFGLNKKLPNVADGETILYPGEQVVLIDDSQKATKQESETERTTNSTFTARNYLNQNSSPTASTYLPGDNKSGLIITLVGTDQNNNGFVEPDESVTYTYKVRNNTDQPISNVNISANGFTATQLTNTTLKPGETSDEIKVTVTDPHRDVSKLVNADVQAFGTNVKGGLIDSNKAKTSLPSTTQALIINTGYEVKNTDEDKIIATGIGSLIALITAGLTTLGLKRRNKKKTVA